MSKQGTPAKAASVLRLRAPLSLWGGLDSTTGVITDPRHPQRGQCIAGRVLLLPGSSGSTSGPSVLADCLRRGKGPVAIMMAEGDLTILAAVSLAQTLYGTRCTVLLKPEADWPEDGAMVSLPDGLMTPSQSPRD